MSSCPAKLEAAAFASRANGSRRFWPCQKGMSASGPARWRTSLWLFASLAMSLPAPAQLLSIDINGATRSDTTAPGFTRWDVGSELTGTRRSVSHAFTNFTYTFDPVTGLPVSTNVSSIIYCTLAETYPAAADSTIYLNANFANKNGNSTSTDPNSGYRLSADACWVHQKDDTQTIDRPYTNGGSFSLTISNLSAGVHTITTYHNDVWGSSFGGTWHGTNVMSRCIINVGGVPIFTNVPTYYATNDSKCGFAFLP